MQGEVEKGDEISVSTRNVGRVLDGLGGECAGEGRGWFMPRACHRPNI